VLAASIRLYWLSAFIREISLPSESVFFLIDSNGNVLADRAAMLDDPARIALADTFALYGGGTLHDFVGQDFAAAVLSRSVSDFTAVGRDGVCRVFASVALPHGDVTVLFGMPTISAIGWLEKDLVNRVLGLAAIVLACLGAAWLGTRYLVTQWTTSLGRMARAYGRGNYSEKASFENAPRELRDLGDTLTLMARRIETREDELRTSLEQKDFFLREIHHRVKNNLQIVSSLLNIRGGGIRGDVERAALNEVKAHVRALALVHRHLYESDDIGRVNLRSFMTELCQSALAGLSRPSQNVSLEIRMPDFMISTDYAIPIALLVTEAMTNSLKHAFPHGQGGRIRVAFEQTGPGAGVLTVADDGVGLPQQDGATTGLGLQLIEAFAKQIGGRLKFSGPPGMVVEVSVDDRAPIAPEETLSTASGTEAAA
jgi:two-component sensor histidine kinase